MHHSYMLLLNPWGKLELRNMNSTAFSVPWKCTIGAYHVQGIVRSLDCLLCYGIFWQNCQDGSDATDTFFPLCLPITPAKAYSRYDYINARYILLILFKCQHLVTSPRALNLPLASIKVAFQWRQLSVLHVGLIDQDRIVTSHISEQVCCVPLHSEDHQ